MSDEKLKRLSTAQSAHYVLLLQQQEIAQQAVNQFANYLAKEHGISSEGWVLHTDRFERQETPAAEDDREN